MPKSTKFTRSDIINSTISLIREAGAEAVSARNVGRVLDSSSKIVFSSFRNMEELNLEVLREVQKYYEEFTKRIVKVGKYVPYKAMGMAYIEFAKCEKELFKLLFMRDRSDEDRDSDNIDDIVSIIQESLGLKEANARMFHIQMWIFVHGIATQIVNGYLAWQEDIVSEMLTDIYEGLKMRFLSKEEG